MRHSDGTTRAPQLFLFGAENTLLRNYALKTNNYLAHQTQNCETNKEYS